MLQKADGTPVPIAEVRAGDLIRTPHGTEAVLVLLHADAFELGRYVELTDEDNTTLRLSSEHYVETNNTLRPAKNVRVGEMWQSVDGERRIVRTQEGVLDSGAFHILTHSLTYYADGVATSCLLNFQQYTTFLPLMSVGFVQRSFDLLVVIVEECARSGSTIDETFFRSLLTADPWDWYSALSKQCSNRTDMLDFNNTHFFDPTRSVVATALAAMQTTLGEWFRFFAPGRYYQ